MNNIDGSNREEARIDAPPPSLLTIVLDTNPHAWALLADTLPLSRAVANLQVFINAHLAFNNANQVAVLASHSRVAQWLYPAPENDAPQSQNIGGIVEDSEGATTMSSWKSTPTDAANKYRPFRTVEQQLSSALGKLVTSTTEADLEATTTTLIAGALSTALTYISKQTLLTSPVSNTSNPNETYSDPSTGLVPIETGIGADGSVSYSNTSGQPLRLTSRILIISVSGDIADQYIPLMNSIFAAQRSRIPIDVLKLAGSTVFLQQASDATNGIYLQPRSPQGLLQYLMMSFLPDATARRHLVAPSQGEVDFRAACFCHRRVVDIGFVCSICLSIFCEPLQDETCLTCGTRLEMSKAFTAQPALIPKKKKKKKRAGVTGDGTPGGTPAPGTPAA